MARIPWRWDDLTEGTVEYMALNPNEDASPSYQKTLTKATSTAPDGQVLLFEGQDQPVTFNFSGAILTEAHYDFLYTAWSKRHPVMLTDDLGRSWLIYIETFQPKRQRSATYPWKHTYQMTTVVLQGGDGD